MGDRYLAVGIESSYGEGATTVNGLRVTSVEFRSIERGVLYDETIEEYLPSAAAAGGLRISGTFEMNLRHMQARNIFKGLMGIETAEDTDLDGNDDKFTYTLGVPQSLELRIGFTPMGGSAEEYKFLGTIINQATFTFSPGEYARMSCDVICRDFTNGTFSEPTYISEDPLVFHQATVYTDSGGALSELATARSVELRINRNIKDDNFIVGDYRLHSIKPGGVVEITGTLTMTEDEANELWYALRGSTSPGGSGSVLGTPKLKIQCGDKFYIYAPIAVYQTSGISISGREEAEKRVEFRVIHDASESFQIVSSDLAL